MGKILIVGDLFPFPPNMKLFSEGDIKTLFGDRICELFESADYRICNLEGALTDGKERVEKTGPIIVAPTTSVNAYKTLGIDYCMLANNHITDAGTIGVLNTMDTLDHAGIKYIGAGKDEESIPHNIILTVDGKNVCIYNVCETMYNKPTSSQAGAWLYDEFLICKELELLKKKCDYLVVIYHGGIEKFRFPSPYNRKRFHRMVDSGADIIISQHSHCIGCQEYYKGSYLLYGQGDFLFKNFNPQITDTGLIVELEINGNHLKINKYKTKTKDFIVRYNEDQDLSDFDERSLLLLNEEYVNNCFIKFCQKELRIYLTAFKSPSFFQRVIKKVFPSYFERWLYFDAFSRRNLLFSLHTLRSEQNRETAIAGIEDLLRTLE